jgi:hypothetical protein
MGTTTEIDMIVAILFLAGGGLIVLLHISSPDSYLK